jgi:hypothetical protein
MNTYKERLINSFFWRTYDQKETDLIEESGGKRSGYEFKWKNEKGKIHKEFMCKYPGSTVETISKENYIDFII